MLMIPTNGKGMQSRMLQAYLLLSLNHEVPYQLHAHC